MPSAGRLYMFHLSRSYTIFFKYRVHFSLNFLKVKMRYSFQSWLRMNMFHMCRLAHFNWMKKPANNFLCSFQLFTCVRDAHTRTSQHLSQSFPASFPVWGGKFILLLCFSNTRARLQRGVPSTRLSLSHDERRGWREPPTTTTTHVFALSLWTCVAHARLGHVEINCCDIFGDEFSFVRNEFLVFNCTGNK